MIGIFSAEGIKLKIAETIQKHLPDEVNGYEVSYFDVFSQNIPISDQSK